MSPLASLVLENMARAKILQRLAERKSSTRQERHALYRAAVHFEQEARECAELVIGLGC